MNRFSSIIEKSLEEKRALTGTFAYLLDYYEHRTLTLT